MNDGNWNDRKWLRLADAYATEGSKDPSTKVGCVIVRPDKTPASWGVNGFPRKIADTPERLADRPTKYDLTIHAELNAMLFSRESLQDYTLYSTFAPCIRCAVNIIQSGITRVVFTESDNERWRIEQARSVSLFVEAGISVWAYPLDGEPRYLHGPVMFDGRGKMIVPESCMVDADPIHRGAIPPVAL